MWCKFSEWVYMDIILVDCSFLLFADTVENLTRFTQYITNKYISKIAFLTSVSFDTQYRYN